MPTDKSLNGFFTTEDAVTAQKALDFLDGRQRRWVEAALSDPASGRFDWRARGFKAEFRNITRSIVEKSGLLFSNHAPQVHVYPETEDKPDVPASENLQDLLEGFDWLEFFNNFDTVVRLQKTALILVEWDAEENQLVPSILTRANAYAQCNLFNGKLELLVVKLSSRRSEAVVQEDGTVGEATASNYYRIFTPTLIATYEVSGTNNTAVLIESVENPYGIIPVAVFHDTQVPRSDSFWNEGPHDLLTIQEMYNLALTDTEYAMTFSKRQTLYTNGEIRDGDSDVPVSPNAAATLVSGPGRVVQLQTEGGQPLFVEYRGPTPDLEALDDMVQRWVTQYALDWDVNVKTGDSPSEGKISGFQLVVEEIGNLQLRQRRQKMCAAGFARLFDVIRTVVNTVRPGTFSDELKLFINFTFPRLPVDELGEEQMWTERIAQGRASRVDYLMKVDGYSKEEALKKLAEIDEYNAQDATKRTEQPTNDGAQDGTHS